MGEVTGLISPPGGSGQIAGSALVSASALGVIPSATFDNTSALNTAFTAAALQGVGIYFPPGVYIYSNLLTAAVSLIGAGPDLTEFRKNTALGKGGALSVQGSNLTIKGIKFTSPNTPSNATNGGVTADAAINCFDQSKVNFEDLVFTNSYGVNIAMKNLVTGRVVNCRAYTCYKDGFHVTGSSVDVELINCLVEDGGDDAFPVVGYTAEGVRPINISHIGCVVRGVKFANAFKYAGAQCCQNVGCKVDGTIPASYGRAATLQSTSAMNILVDNSAGTYGNEDLQITGFQAINCGRGGSPFAGIANAIHIIGATGLVTRNIRFTNLTIRNSASQAIGCDGNVTAGIENLEFIGVNIIDTSDVNGYTATAGTAKFAGINIRNTHNCKIVGSLSDTGGGGASLDISNTGFFDVELKTYRINKGSATTTCRIVDTVNTNSTIQKLKLRLTVCEQAQAASGSQYFISAPVWFNTRGIIELLQVEFDAGVPSQQFVFGNLLQDQTIGASPYKYQNTSGAKQVLQINVGTATGVTIAKGNYAPGGTLAANAAFGPATSISGTLFFYLTLAPGECTQLVYTAVGTMKFSVGPAEGL